MTYLECTWIEWEDMSRYKTRNIPLAPFRPLLRPYCVSLMARISFSAFPTLYMDVRCDMVILRVLDEE